MAEWPVGSNRWLRPRHASSTGLPHQAHTRLIARFTTKSPFDFLREEKIQKDTSNRTDGAMWYFFLQSITSKFHVLCDFLKANRRRVLGEERLLNLTSQAPESFLWASSSLYSVTAPSAGARVHINLSLNEIYDCEHSMLSRIIYIARVLLRVLRSAFALERGAEFDVKKKREIRISGDHPSPLKSNPQWGNTSREKLITPLTLSFHSRQRQKKSPNYRNAKPIVCVNEMHSGFRQHAETEIEDFRPG
jgi:hypothetical protein